MSEAAEEVVRVARQGAVLSVTMNRPKRLNGLDEGLADALLAAFSGIAEDRSIRAVVLAGAGRSFMAGGDLSRFHVDLDAAPRTAAGLIDRFHGLMRLIKAMPQPVIAAVQGPVAGGGVGLALACDLVIAAQDATFLSAYTKLGTNPDGGTTWSLTQLLGPRRALEFVLLNEPLDAQAALRLGLVNSVVPNGELDTAAMTLAERLAQASFGATKATKALIGSATTGTFEDQLDLEKRAFVANAGDVDFREGIQAFFERRTPRF
jgi:2-(1,2-epoxy-1,2-dihydrophenyl)acetyl-CoA isomerase